MATCEPTLDPESASPDRLDALRARIRTLEGGGGAGRRVLPLGPKALDDHLPGGGLALAGLHEVAGERSEWDDGVALGFALALLSRLALTQPPTAPGAPILWVAPRLDLHPPALLGFGLAPERLVLVRAPEEAARLWALEEGLRSGAFAALVGELAEPDRTAGRRLQLAAETAGLPCLLLRRRLFAARGGPGGSEAPSAAVTRWRVAPLPSAPVEGDESLPGRARWRVELLRCRGAAPGNFLVEWDHETGDFGLVTALRDGSSYGRSSQTEKRRAG